MKRIFIALALLVAACGTPEENVPSDPLLQQLNITQPLSDTNNLCSSSATSPFVTLPRDYAYHYTLPPLNRQPTVGSIGTGFESTFKFWHWTAIPRGGGAPVRIGAFRAFFASYIFSPFTMNFDWVKILLFQIVGPDNIAHQFLYLAPGEYGPMADGYDLSVGAEGIVVEATDAGFVPVVAGPAPAFARAVQVGGGSTRDTFNLALVGQPGFSIETVEAPLKSPNFPFGNGFGEYRDFVTNELYSVSYYWARSLMATTAKVKYAGTDYIAVGTSWEERQWPGSGDLRWNWTSIQIKGCRTASGALQLNCPYAGMTIGAFDIINKQTGNPANHSLNIVSAPPACASDSLFALSDWTLSEVAQWTSPRSGVTYGSALRLQVPPRNIDLTITATIEDQETYKAAFVYPGTWEGDALVEGTINGQRVFGDAFYEQFNKNN